jgi:hypothetical protein
MNVAAWVISRAKVELRAGRFYLHEIFATNRPAISLDPDDGRIRFVPFGKRRRTVSE